MTRAVVLPGRAYPVTAPLLAAAVGALEASGYDVRPVVWDDAPLGPDGARDERERFVVRHLEAAIVGAVEGLGVLVVAKSLGTLAAGRCAERGWPAVWLTPLLRDVAVVAALRENPAPQLLVGGRADELWDADTARALADEHGCEVLEVPGADHAMKLPADPGRDADVLRRVERAVEGFVAGLRGRS